MYIRMCVYVCMYIYIYVCVYIITRSLSISQPLGSELHKSGKRSCGVILGSAKSGLAVRICVVEGF